MKLDFSLLAIISTHTVELCGNKQENCFLSELTKPDNFAKWDCSASVTLEFVFNFIWSFRFRHVLAPFHMEQNALWCAKRVTCLFHSNWERSINVERLDGIILTVLIWFANTVVSLVNIQKFKSIFKYDLGYKKALF